MKKREVFKRSNDDCRTSSAAGDASVIVFDD